MKGLIQIYCGEGKGKTTAAIGAGRPERRLRTFGGICTLFEDRLLRRADFTGTDSGNPADSLRKKFWILLEYDRRGKKRGGVCLSGNA